MTLSIKTIAGLALALLGFVGPAAAQSTATPSTATLRLASAFPPPSVSYNSLTAQLWMDEVTKRTEGRIKFQAFWGASLGKPSEHLDLVEKGVADIVLTNAQFTPGKLPLAQFEYVFPFGPVDPVVVTKAKRRIHEEFPQFAADLGKYNIVPIFNASGSVYQVLSKAPIAGLGDFNGKKVAVIGRYFGRWLQAVGAVPVVVPAHERYSMLQSGVIDADFLPVDMFDAFKTYEQAKNLILVDALVGNFLDLWINKAAFAKLDPQTQKILLDAGRDVELRVAAEAVPAKTAEVLKRFKEKEINFVALPPEDRARWAAETPDLPAEWATEVTAQGYPGHAIVQRYQEITTELGHHWTRRWDQAQ